MKTTTLESLRLPELQARYAEVIGETTKSPNKTYLIRRIREALAAKEAEQAKNAKQVQAAAKAAETAAQAKPAKTAKQRKAAVPLQQPALPAAMPASETAATASIEQPASAPEVVFAAAPTAAQEPAPAPAALASTDAPRQPVPEPASAVEELLASADEEEMLDFVDDEMAERTDDESAPDTSDAEDASSGEKPLRKMSVAELQQRYVEVVGRPTGSSDSRYLIWKIREAQKGRVPVGPRTRRSPSEPAPEHMILPVRMEAALVQRLDAARERIGLKSRMDLFRKALSVYLATAGEPELAAALAPEA